MYEPKNRDILGCANTIKHDIYITKHTPFILHLYIRQRKHIAHLCNLINKPTPRGGEGMVPSSACQVESSSASIQVCQILKNC